MRRIKLLLTLLVVLSISISIVYSETIEESLLKKREQRILNYLYQAKAGTRNLKLAVLDNILEEYEESNYSNRDKKLVELVIYLSEEGTIRQEYENNRLINDFPDVRRKSCIVLGKLGGKASRDALINILANESNSTVKAEAVMALSQFEDSSTGEALRALVYAYRSTYKPDPNFVFAVINAVKKIARGNVAAYSDAILILSEIQMGQYNRKIRDAAYDAIQSLAESE